MKHKTQPLLLLCSLFLFFTSCAGDPERHQLTPVTGACILFADQTADSILFYTFDSWTVKSQSDWIRIEGDSQADIKYDYARRYLCRVDVSMQPNTTGHTREGLVLVNGELETRRGKKLRDGDEVSAGGNTFVVRAMM